LSWVLEAEKENIIVITCIIFSNTSQKVSNTSQK